MARVSGPTKSVNRSGPGRKPGRPASAAASRRASAAAAPAPKLSKDELRAKLEKLERANATLRVKNRETSRIARDSDARIAELEQQVARLETTLASRAAPARRGRTPAEGRARRRGREIDPGDAVPPGVAVEEPAPLDGEAETARENLEEHLGGE